MFHKWLPVITIKNESSVFKGKLSPPQTQFELASMLTALYCVTMIHQLFQGRACTNTILVKL